MLMFSSPIKIDKIVKNKFLINIISFIVLFVVCCLLNNFYRYYWMEKWTCIMKSNDDKIDINCIRFHEIKNSDNDRFLYIKSTSLINIPFINQDMFIIKERNGAIHSYFQNKIQNQSLLSSGYSISLLIESANDMVQEKKAHSIGEAINYLAKEEGFVSFNLNK